MISTINVFGLNNNELVCYQCFFVRSSKLYGVLSKFTYSKPVNTEQIKSFEESYIAGLLFADEDTLNRTYSTLEQAVSNHEKLSGTLFKSFDIWKRISDNRIDRYRCFEILPDRGFCVQSKDSYNDSFDRNSIAYLEKNFLELISDISPLDRRIYSTIEEAIVAFDGII